MSAIMCLQSSLYEVLEVAEKVLFVLSHWVVLLSFYEADWWHFTDPSNTGISMKAIVIIILALFVPTLLFQFKRFVLGKKIHFAVIFMLKMVLSLLLFLTSLPILAHYPWIRTALLATGVGFSPLILTVVFSHTSIQSRKLKIEGCICSESCFMPSMTREQSSSLRSETAPIKSFVAENSKSRDLHSEAIILVAFLLNMVMRWIFASINIFYETWQASLILFISLTLFASLNAYQERKTYFGPELRNRRSIGSASTHTEILMAAEIGDKTPNTKNYSLKKSHRNSLVKLASLTDDDDTLSSAGSNLPSAFEKSFSDGIYNSNSLRVGLLFFAGAIQSIALGTLLVLFIWVFSTPNLLVRWSGESPQTHGVSVIVLFSVGIIVSMCIKVVLNATTSPSSKKIFKTNTKHEQITCWLMDILVLAIVIGVLVSASILQMQGATVPLSFVGSGLLCVVLPCCFTMNLVGIKHLLTICGCLHSTPLLMSIFLSFVAFFTAVAFLASHLLLVLFVNPQITSLFLGRMDIILAYQILVIIACITIAVITNRIVYVCQRHFDVKLSSTLLKTRSIILLLFCILLLMVGCTVTPVFTPRHCMQDHSSSYHQIGSHFGDRSFSNNTFSVLSWNILLGHDKYGRDNLPCVGETLQVLKPDVIGLEESEALPPYWGSKDIPAYLTSFLGNAMKAYLGVQPLESSLGVAFLTNETVLRHQSYLLPADESNKLPHYSLVRIDCLINNYTVTIFNVHAAFKNWTATENNICPFANASEKQINFIAQKVLTIKKSQPIILMGDFNLNPNESQLDILHNLGFENALHKNRDLNPPSTLRNRFAIVDHIFYRGLTLIEGKTVVESGDISDHNPVIAYFQMPT